MRWIVALVVWAAAVAGAAGLSSVVAANVHDEQASGGSSSSSFDAGAVAAADKNSLFHAVNLGKALSIARSHIGSGATLDSLVMYPGYLSITQVKGGREVDVYVNAAGRFDTTALGSHSGDTQLYSFARVSAAAPAQIAQRIAALAHTPLSQLHYMIFERDSDTHRLIWRIYTVEGNPITYFVTAGPHAPLFKLGPSGLARVRG
jgi:hypothetical protein